MSVEFAFKVMKVAARPIRLALLINFIAVALVPALAQNRRKQTPRSSAKKTYEKICGADVRPNQVLFRVSECPETLSPAKSLGRFEEIVKASVDETLILNQVGDGCVILATSSKSTVSELLLAFQLFFSQRTLKVDRLLEEAGLKNLRSDYVEPNFILRGDAPDLTVSPPVEPNDDKYVKGELWGLVNPKFRGLDIDAPSAWKYSTGCGSIVAGVVDSGVYYHHPDLAANMWTAPRRFSVVLGGRTITCGKGTHGYNALAKPGSECAPDDDNGHGTHVAGVIGAVGNNHIGVVGVNWIVKLMALKFLDANNEGSIDGAINAIEFALQAQDQLGPEANLKVLNNSWSVSFDSKTCPYKSNALRDEIEKAERRGILFVASAGENSADNDVTPHYPSGYNLSNIISVTAINNDGALTTIQRVGSNLGKTTVHLAAPGDDIWSTCLPQKGYYCQKSFTSVAAPFVSGAGALMFSIPSCAKLGSGGIKTKILEGTVRTPSMVNPITNEKLTVTGGRLNLADSIALCF